MRSIATRPPGAASQTARKVRRRIERAGIEGFNSINTYERRVMSENGEDGIIKEIFFRIGHDKRFVEFGAADGSESNAAVLGQFYGWSGLLIEGDPASCDRLRARLEGRGDVTVLNEMVSRENIAGLFRRANVPVEFDLLSIDIDGNDYWVWEALRAYRPRLVVIEYNAHPRPRAVLDDRLQPAS